MLSFWRKNSRGAENSAKGDVTERSRLSRAEEVPEALGCRGTGQHRAGRDGALHRYRRSLQLPGQRRWGTQGESMSGPGTERLMASEQRGWDTGVALRATEKSKK
ncbi:transmembrane protease serine 5-like [Platysternon megacephalum]|uniref:Transmembrane protease serine 5-like n=1 Tax=Platysternon megacephalum TaxID=55544 RepID=A0A4D9E811_9SAUR|nr:transmembrane protease serine 5-like [Platysternon megacephalum]